MLGIRGFWKRSRKRDRPDTMPQPVVSDEAIEMRSKADERLKEAREIYWGALTISERLQALREGEDDIANALLAVKGRDK